MTTQEVRESHSSSDLYMPFTLSALFDTLMEIFGRKPERESDRVGPEPELSQKSAGIRGARVLLVEDNLINQQVAVELLQDFRWQLRDVVVEIRSLLEQDKREEMRFLAHNIKGASANLGATDLRKSAARLEEAIKVGTRSEIEARLVKFEADRGIVLETIRGFVQADPPVAFEGREQVEPGKDSR